jgi:hypothetical protein
MNKRMKDPKGDLRFVHKSTRIYDFSSLKLTAMTYRRQACSVYFHCIFFKCNRNRNNYFTEPQARFISTLFPLYFYSISTLLPLSLLGTLYLVQSFLHFSFAHDLYKNHLLAHSICNRKDPYKFFLIHSVGVIPCSSLKAK